MKQGSAAWHVVLAGCVANLFRVTVKPGQEALHTPPRVFIGGQWPEARFKLQSLRFLPV